MDIDPKSYHLTAFELINQLLYINFPSFGCRIFLKDQKSTFRRILRCDFVTSLISLMPPTKCYQSHVHPETVFHV